MNLKISYWLWPLVVCAALTYPAGTNAQDNPTQVLRSVIQQLQTGKPNPTWFGESLWLLIALGTNGSGVYPQLVELGPAQKITVTATVPLPFGVAYAITAQHERGTSNWEYAVSNLTNRIEYMDFVANPRMMTAPPAPNPEEPAPPPQRDGSEACKKFPNLC
jgi:hypothetical protein